MASAIARGELVGDGASDPPLGATARRLAVTRPGDVLYGLGVIAKERRARRLRLVVRHEDAREALAREIARLEAKVELMMLPDAWPPQLGAAVPVEELVRVADRTRGRPERRFVTVAGAVRAPAVLEVEPGTTVEALVARAGGSPSDDAWLAVAGGAPSGRLVDRDAPVEEVGTLLLVLPVGHEVVRRLKTPVSDWLLRAASACEGCRVCSDSCPAALGGSTLRPHELLATLVSGRDDGVALADALSCTGCGLCDAMCPSALSPRALVTGVRDRLRAGGVERETKIHSAASGLSVPLLVERLGLVAYDRPVA